MRIQSLNHSTYQHQYHIVWGTKYRRRFLKSYVKQAFVHSLYQTATKYPVIYIQAINIDEDHVHIQVEIAPSISVSKSVQLLKAESSRLLKYRFKFIRDMYPEGNIWSVGFYSSTIGLNEETIRRYIEYQGRQDLPQQPSFEFS